MRNAPTPTVGALLPSGPIASIRSSVVWLAMPATLAWVGIVSACALGIAARSLSPWLLPSFLLAAGLCGASMWVSRGAGRWLASFLCLAVTVAGAYTFMLASYRSQDACIRKVGGPLAVTFDPVHAQFDCAGESFNGQPARTAVVPLGELLLWPVYAFQ